jgi:hypothetical protein
MQMIFVVDLEQIDRTRVIILAQRVGDAGVVVGGDDLQACRRLRRERADVGVSRDIIARGE